LTSADRELPIKRSVLLQLTKYSEQIPNQRLNIDTEVAGCLPLDELKTIPEQY